MTDARTPSPDPSDLDRDEAVEMIEEEAATIDPRSPNAAERIRELEVEADELDLPTTSPAEVDTALPDQGLPDQS